MKTKICKKGTGKAKGFEGCGKELSISFRNRSNFRYGLGISCGCYSNWLLTTKEGNKTLEKATLKATKPRRELEKFEREEKERKSLNWLLKNTAIACHTYIKLRDKGKPCISCGEPYNSSHQAGHFYKAELFSSLKFDERNINGQCVGCNIHKEGNESQYRVNLPKRIGQEAYDELNKLAKEDKIKDHKWDREELKKMRSYYLKKIKQLKNETK